MAVPKRFQCTAETLHIGRGAAIQKIDVAGCQHDAIHAHGIAADEHSVDAVLIECDNEVEEVRR